MLITIWFEYNLVWNFCPGKFNRQSLDLTNGDWFFFDLTYDSCFFQVVKQLNMAVILKGRDGPVYEKDELKNFCLVAVIGSRERCLRDDFRPLNLQNPWKSGKLFVRMKNDLLAAFERTSIETSNNCLQDTASNSTQTTTLLWKWIGHFLGRHFVGEGGYSLAKIEQHLIQSTLM